MSDFSTDAIIHKRISTFVDWIKPEDSNRDETIKRAKAVRENVIALAKEDGLVILGVPYAGSFASKTGLRRHFRGNAEVEGQDVDLPFFLKEVYENGRLTNLLDQFANYAKEAYPKHEVKPTKSSVKLIFSDHISFDLVPCL